GFKGLLGIESPSKVFHGFGVDIGEGLAQGIESSEGRVRQAVQRLYQPLDISKSAFGSRTVGMVSLDGWIAAITEGLEGHDQMLALQRELRELERQRAAIPGFDPTRHLARGVIDWRTRGLEQAIED